jgi:Holliday junction resolvase RusA-like endonuclease
MRIFLDYPPSANDRLTARKGGRGFVNTARYRSWMDKAQWIVALAVRGRRKIAAEYRMSVVACPPQTVRVRDLDNLMKAIGDALKKGGAVEDDSLCQEINMRWGEIDGPGVLVEIESCPALLSRGTGRSKSTPGTEKSPRPRRSPRAATIQDAGILEFSATAQEVWRALGKKPSSIPAESTACPKARDKPKT